MSKVMVSHSDDGGRTWSAERLYTMETAGDRLRRVRIFADGYTYNRIYKLAWNSNHTLISGHARIGAGV